MNNSSPTEIVPERYSVDPASTQLIMEVGQMTGLTVHVTSAIYGAYFPESDLPWLQEGEKQTDYLTWWLELHGYTLPKFGEGEEIEQIYIDALNEGETRYPMPFEVWEMRKGGGAFIHLPGQAYNLATGTISHLPLYGFSNDINQVSELIECLSLLPTYNPSVHLIQWYVTVDRIECP